MRILTTLSELCDFRASLPPSSTLGFVPTMGALHAGHASLLTQCAQQCDVSLASIFVNPAQFAPGEDLATYPRTHAADIAMCRAAALTAVFCPLALDVYPPDFGTFVTAACGEAPRNKDAEGASRPTFFRGVATVLAKLFVAVRPHKVFFGQKDAQQCAVVKQLVRDLWMDIDVVVAPTVREADGLAMSSRNKYLTEAERRHAPVVYRALLAAQGQVRSGQRDAEALRLLVRGLVKEEMKGAADVQFELMYVSVCDKGSMAEVNGEIEKGNCVMCVAAMLGKTRLIDNVDLDGSG